MPTPVYLSELADALEWLSAGEFGSAAYVSRKSGQVFWRSESGGLDEEAPEDVDDETLYAALPDKRDFDLKQRLIFRFIEANASDAYDQVRGFFSRRGAYGRFKDLLERRGLSETWYTYDERATESALREWAESEGFEVVEGARAPG